MSDIRKAKLSDLKAISSIAERCPEIPRWSPALLEGEIVSPKSYFCVFSEARLLSGFAGYLRVLDEAQVTLIAVDPERRRHGIGRALLSHLKETARAENLAKMTLEVSADNASALALYRAEGFESVGRRPKFYNTPAGTSDAVLMDLRL